MNRSSVRFRQVAPRTSSARRAVLAPRVDPPAAAAGAGLCRLVGRDLVVLLSHLGALTIAVAAYGIVLGLTAAFALRCHTLVAVGGMAFLVSDTILAFRLFLPGAMPAWTSPAVMLTYTLGQALIAVGASSRCGELSVTPSRSARDAWCSAGARLRTSRGSMRRPAADRAASRGPRRVRRAARRRPCAGPCGRV